MMIDGKIHISGIALGKHFLRGNIHRNDEARLKVLRRVKWRNKGQELGDDLGIGIEPGCLSQAAQAGTEGGSAAHGVPVRVAVGDQKDPVLLTEKGGSFLRSHRSHPRRA